MMQSFLTDHLDILLHSFSRNLQAFFSINRTNIILEHFERRFMFIHAGASKQEEVTEQAVVKTYSLEDLKQSSEKPATEFEKDMKAGGVQQCLQVLEKRKEWKSQEVNLAITGRSGTGKSSFINALVKVWTGKRGPAEVGLTETTKECVGYAHPDNPNITLWDLPGVGTELFPQENYLTKVKAHLYDVFLIMTDTRFSEVDVWLGRELLKNKTPAIFVRTKIDTTICNSKLEYPEKDIESVLREVKADMMDKIPTFVKIAGVFLIDNHNFDKYEFRALEKCIVEKLSEFKGQALVLSVTRMSKDNLQLKIAELKKQILATAMKAACPATIPGLSAYTDANLVTDTASHYMNQLGLDLTSLETTSTNQLKLEKIKSKVDEVMKQIPEILSCSGAGTLDGSVQSGSWNLFSRFVPGVNTCISAVTVAISLADILFRLESISGEAIDAFSE